MAITNDIFCRGLHPMLGHFVGFFYLALGSFGKISKKSVLVAVFSFSFLQCLFAGQAFERQEDPYGIRWYFSSVAVNSNPDASSLVVSWSKQNPGSGFTYSFKNVSGQSKMTGSSRLANTGAGVQWVGPRGETALLYEISVANLGGSYYYKEALYWSYVSPYNGNDVSGFQQQFISFIESARGSGVALNANVVAFDLFLNGIPPNPDTPTYSGTGGSFNLPTPENPSSNPVGSVTQGGGGSSTTTSTTNGNTSVTTTNSNSTTYTYNYDNRVTNNTTGPGSSEPINLTPVVDAVNSNGQKIDTQTQHIDDGLRITGEKIDTQTLHIDDGLKLVNDGITDLKDAITTSGGVTGAGLSAISAPTQGATAAQGKFGGMVNSMAISGHSGYTMTFVIPWAGGSTRNYVVSSLPVPGSSLDSFRLVLRTCLTVMVAIAFVFLCVKTLRYY